MGTRTTLPLAASVRVLKAPAAERNKQPLTDALKKVIPITKALALEIASGTGQHVVHFAQQFTNVTWLPSDCDQASIESIKGYIAATEVPNVLEPGFLDTTQPSGQWVEGRLEPQSCDIVLCVNMIHISEWASTLGLFHGAGGLLKPGGALVTYGPYKIDGLLSPDSNVRFDQSLKSQNPEWGIRDIKDLEKVALDNGMTYEQMIDMPANNKTLIFRKASS